MRRPARNFATSSKKRDRDVEEEREARQERVRRHAGRDAVVRVLDRGGERERHRLGRRRARLLHVLADDRERVPARQVLVAPRDVVDEHAACARKRQPEEHVVRDEVRQVVALVRRPADRAPVDAPALRGREHEREQRERRRVVHRARGGREVDAVEAGRHVVGAVDDDAAGAEELRVDLVHVVAAEHRVAGNERDRGGALVEDVAQALVVGGRRAEPDQLPLRPRAAAVHRRVDAARVRRLAREPDVGVEAGGVDVERRVERPDRDAGAVVHRRVGADLRRVLGGPADLRLVGGGGDGIGERLVHRSRGSGGKSGGTDAGGGLRDERGRSRRAACPDGTPGRRRRRAAPARPRRGRCRRR